MFATVIKPYRPWAALWGLGVLAGMLLFVFAIQVCWPQFLKIEVRVPDITDLQLTRLVKPPKAVPSAARSRKETSPVHAEDDPEKITQSSTASAVPGTPRWEQHVERGRGLSLDIVAEESLGVLRAYGVPIAMDIGRPRGNVLLYDLQNHTVSHGVVAPDAVCREMEGLPAEFDAPLRAAERELGGRPHVWALYPADLFAALRSLTEDALRREVVQVESVKAARVRLSISGGRAFSVKLVSHF